MSTTPMTEKEVLAGSTRRVKISLSGARIYYLATKKQQLSANEVSLVYSFHIWEPVVAPGGQAAWAAKCPRNDLAIILEVLDSINGYVSFTTLRASIHDQTGILFQPVELASLLLQASLLRLIDVAEGAGDTVRSDFIRAFVRIKEQVDFLYRMYEKYPELHDVMDIQKIIPMSLGEWSLELGSWIKQNRKQ